MPSTYSVVILTYNQLHKATIPCIESVLAHSPLDKTEIIVVDNASTDGTPEYLRHVRTRAPKFSVILHSDNIGFSAGNNAGLRQAQGEYIVILNNDTLVTPGWLERLTAPFKEHAKTGLAGPVTNYAGTEQRIQLDGITERNYVERAQQYTQAQRGVHFETQRLSFFCVALRRSVLTKVGFLDEQFTRGMFEDDDYCQRVMQAGYTISVAEDCFVYHKGSISFNALQRKTYEDLFEKNKALFERKHQRPYVYSDEATAYFRKLKLDVLENRRSGSVAALERIHVRLSIIEDFLTFLKQKDVEQHTAVQRMMIDQCIPAIPVQFEGLEREHTLLLTKLRNLQANIDVLNNDLSNIFESPLFAAWQKFSRLKRRVRDVVVGRWVMRRANPYDLISYLKDIEIVVLAKDFSSHTNRKFSVVVTVMNEEKTIGRLLASMLDQSLIPDEVIIVDGGSTDNTVNVIKNSALREKTHLVVLQGKYNIPKGRNVGIHRARNDVIVTTDAGCTLDWRFFQNITGPMFASKRVDLVGGTYTSWHNAKNTYFVPHWEKNNWNIFLPSARAAAFRKSHIKKAGYFPENLETGEDTLFAILYRSLSKKWVYNTSALVHWKNPQNYVEHVKLAFRYGYGDGQSGVGDWSFYDKVYAPQTKDLTYYTEKDAFIRGYMKGRSLRAENEHNVVGLKEVSIVFIDSISESVEKLITLIQRLQRKNHKCIVVFTSAKGNRLYLSPITFAHVEFIHLQDFTLVDMVDRYANRFTKLNVLNLSMLKTRFIRTKTKNLEAFFTVKYE